MKNILVATSISPRNIEKQVESFTTWEPVASRIVTLNHTDEVSTIKPKVPFEVVEVDRSAKEMLGKPFVFIDSFLEYFADAPETHLLIVNSDIYLSEPDTMAKIIDGVDAELLFGQRVDVEKPESNSGDLFGGFDYFLLSKEGAALYPKSEFCMGAPWWDHWMPIVPMSMGKRAVLCSEPIVLHLIHETNWGIDPQAILGYHMGLQLLSLWNNIGEELQKADPMSPEGRAIRFAYIFAKYFAERRKIIWDYYPKFEQLPQPLKGEVSWDMTDVFPYMTIEYIFNFAERINLNS